MSAPAFTPGPWWAAPSDYGHHKTLVRAADGSARRIADTFCQLDGGDPTINAANAHLIAAAPELYEALEWAVNDFDGNTRCNAEQLANCIEKCRSALAKARGESA